MCVADGTVEVVGEGDLDQILELYRHLHAGDDALDPAEARKVWAEILGFTGMQCFVVRLGGRLVASCVLVVIPNLTRGGRPYGVIENVVTHADFRRRGLGKRVLEHAVAAAWEAGCYKVMLMTGRKDPGTLRFYEEAGFQGGVKTAFEQRPEA